MVAIEEETSEHIKNSPSPTSACIASEQRPEKKAAATGKISRPKSEGSERRRPGSGLKAPRDLATEFKSLSVSAPSKTPSPISSPKEPVLSPGLSPLSKEDEKIVLPTATSMTLSPKVKKIRFFDVEKQLQEQIRDIDGRIHRWKAQWFASHSDDSLDFHTYPFQIASLVRAFGEKEQWASTRTGLLNDHYVCIGEIHRYSKGKDPVLGVFSEAFSKEDNKLYHHFFHPRNMSHLTQRFQETRSFFDTDSAGTQKVQSEFQKFLFEKAKKEGSFFDSLDGIPPKKCCKDRFFVQINGATIRVDDTNFGTAYTLTAKL